MGPHRHDAPAESTVRRAFAVGVGLNVAFVVVEVTFGLLTGSLALLADAGHNISDVLGLVLAWVAHLLAQRKPTERQTYGYRRGTILASLTSAILLTVAMGIIAWEAVGRFNDPPDVAPVTVMAVAGVGFVINLVAAMLFYSGRKSDLNLKGAFLHLAADAAISLGVVAGGLAILLSGQAWIDPALSLGIVVLILWGTWGLLRDSLGLAVDRVPREIDPAQVRDYLCRQKGVVNVHDLHIWAMSTTETALTAHLVRPDREQNDEFLHELAENLQTRFSISHSTIQIEQGPDVGVCHADEDKL